MNILYTRQAQDFLRKTDPALAHRILQKIELLQHDPFRGAQRVKGTSFYRVRVGAYRLLYDIDTKAESITIIKIDHRSRVYDA